MSSRELLRLQCRGHRDIRASHSKTLEFITSADITGRATCVVGVATTVQEPSPKGLAGPLRITLTIGGHSVTVRALGNSAWRPGSSAVVRVSSQRLPNTLATDADLAAADLPRELLHSLRHQDSVIDVLVESDREPAEGRLVLYRAGQGDENRLAAEIAAAETVIAQDVAAGRVLSSHGVAADPWAAAPGTVERGGRVLAVSTMETHNPVVGQLLAGIRPAVEVIGLPDELAVAAVSPCSGPVLLASAEGRRRIAGVLAAHRSFRVVFRTPAADLPKILEEAKRTLGIETAALAAVSMAERPWWGPVLEAESQLPTTGDVLCCVDPPQGAQADTADYPGIDHATLVRALLAQSVSHKTLALALAQLPTWSRKRAYDFVLEVARES
ncbi:hypothetical protein GCM10020367_30820 [Streptomyces sannanensis]|uniref:DUF371 domain-containing protein n=1 Tax=Streptomyces sannanensis TaxID=285536 RepID=A0ABP6SC55_9ACTN